MREAGTWLSKKHMIFLKFRNLPLPFFESIDFISACKIAARRLFSWGNDRVSQDYVLVHFFRSTYVSNLGKFGASYKFPSSTCHVTT
jgi:hypothetical protein